MRAWGVIGSCRAWAFKDWVVRLDICGCMFQASGPPVFQHRSIEQANAPCRLLGFIALCRPSSRGATFCFQIYGVILSEIHRPQITTLTLTKPQNPKPYYVALLSHTNSRRSWVRTLARPAMPAAWEAPWMCGFMVGFRCRV